MNDLFARMIDKHTPKMNPEVMNGLACTYMKRAEEYVDSVFRSVSRSFPAGLVYLGYERCTPAEEYNEVTKTRNNKRFFDLASSYIYLVKYKFAFNGEPLPDRFVYLPFVEEGGLMRLGGALFHVTPVLSDKVISPGYDSVFVRLLRDKITFRRCYHTVVIDDVRETTHVVWSRIYRKPKDNKSPPNTTKANTSIAHYLFAKFGFSGTFQKYCGFVPEIGGANINTSSYPVDQWVICQSSQVKPKTFIGDFYNPTDIRIAIPREKWNNMAKALVCGFFYVVDHFPARFKAGYVDQTLLWTILLGHIVFSGMYGEGKLAGQINEHFASLDDYMDIIIRDKLRESGVIVEDFYDLIAMISSEFNILVTGNENNVLSMYGKSLEVLYYALYDISAGIINVNFRLGKLASKKPLTIEYVRETFNANMKMRAIFGLASGKIITESVSFSGDHKYPKITAKITEQESLPGATRGKSRRLVVTEMQHIDISMTEAGSVLFLSKSNPTPTNHINPFVHLDLATGTILPNPKFDEIRERTKNLFTRRHG